jgi:hypothetical protein
MAGCDKKDGKLFVLKEDFIIFAVAKVVKAERKTK